MGQFPLQPLFLRLERAGRRGDQIVAVRVELPEHLTPEQCQADFGMNHTLQLDDYPYVHFMHRIDDELVKAVTGEHYEGGHWLGSFAVYLVTARGR